MPSELDPWYVTGLVELAGTFTFSRSDRNVALYFGLKMGHGEGALLEAIHGFFGGAGRIYAISSRKGHTPLGGVKPALYYRMTRLADLDLVILHFDVFPLRGRKADSYRIWREMVDLKRSAFRRPERERLGELCASLSSLSARTRSIPPN